jgi:hypothetical protein
MNLAYEEFVDFIAAGTTPQGVIDYRPSEETKARVADLIHRRKTAALSADEADELAQYLHVEHLMRLAKARARQRLAASSKRRDERPALRLNDDFAAREKEQP